MTKEPKLVSAVRIVREWPDYDNEIKRLQERVAENKSKSLNDEKTSGKYSFLIMLATKWAVKVKTC